MTELTDFQEKIAALLPDVELKFDEPLAKHTSLRIGGGAEVMAFPKNAEELAEILKVSVLLDGSFAILGAGTNVLAPDEGVRGLVVCLKDCLEGIEPLPGNRLRVMAGVTMSRAAVAAANLGLSGLEFAHGIPGTVGGGVYMNAGAYGGEMKDVLQSVRYLAQDGDIVEAETAALDLSYRHSIFEENGGCILSATFHLKRGDPDAIKARMNELMAKRIEKQPLDKPSAGSTFKRPLGAFAAALIDQCGLRGYRHGGAAVSEKHCGFVVNLGGATCADVLALCEEVRAIVKEKTGYDLEKEIRVVR